MKKTVKYTSDKGEIVGSLRRIQDFLPPPEKLLTTLEKNGPKTKVTLELDDDALAFFKREASRRKSTYQRMIRNLVRSYARAQSGTR